MFFFFSNIYVHIIIRACLCSQYIYMYDDLLSIYQTSISPRLQELLLQCVPFVVVDVFVACARAKRKSERIYSAHAY